MHLYGDQLGDVKFHPHVNVHIVEEKNVVLKLSLEGLENIKSTWLRALRGLGCKGIKTVDVHYKFRIKMRQKIHAVKYMSRPTWDFDHIRNSDMETNLFLLLELKGFQYIRFWGALANCRYEDTGMMLKEEKLKIEKLIGGKLRKVGIEKGVNYELLKKIGELEEISPGFYRVKRKGKRHE